MDDFKGPFAQNSALYKQCCISIPMHRTLPFLTYTFNTELTLHYLSTEMRSGWF